MSQNVKAGDEMARGKSKRQAQVEMARHELKQQGTSGNGKALAKRSRCKLKWQGTSQNGKARAETASCEPKRQGASQNGKGLAKSHPTLKNEQVLGRGGGVIGVFKEKWSEVDS